MIWSEQYGWNNKAEIIPTKQYHFKMEGIVGAIWLVGFGWRIFMKGRVEGYHY